LGEESKGEDFIDKIIKLTEKFFDECTDKESTTVGDIIRKIQKELGVDLALQHKSAIQRLLKKLSRTWKFSENDAPTTTRT